MEETRELAICNTKGLHARASARFVETVERFDAHVSVSKDGQTVGGDSIMGLLMLAAAKGSTIQVSAQGPDAKEVIDALATLVEDRFGEDS